MTFQNIPLELRMLRQWINWRSVTITDESGNVKTTKQPVRSYDLKLASVIDPRDWSNFDDAIAAAGKTSGIGFVFTKSDPFCGVDLDAPASAEQFANHTAIYQRLNSYSELSPSGKGVHIIVKSGLPGPGRKRNKVEIYDTARFFTFTGNVCNQQPIQERYQEIKEIWSTLASPMELIQTDFKGDANEVITDNEVLKLAANAANGEKFKRLWSGDWQTEYGKQSQSEADFALIDILAFYSRNAVQVGRMFRNSALGQREKAKRNDYVNRMVKRSFDKMPPLLKQHNGWHFDAAQYNPWIKPVPLALAPAYVPPIPEGPRLPAAMPAVMPAELPDIPGLVGKLILHCWQRAVYPVPEVAIASGLATMSLLAGRTYRIGTDGLSLYLLLLAKTSTGKGFGYQAQNDLRRALLELYANPTGGAQYKARTEFLQNMFMQNIGSAPGLAQHILNWPSCLAQLDEFVKRLRVMSDARANTNDQQMLAELLQLTDVARPGQVYMERSYSQRGAAVKTKELRKVYSACLTILGTGTPGEFYDNLSPSLLQEGLIPRFIIMEYEGLMPPKQKPIVAIPEELLSEVIFHVNKAFMFNDACTGKLEDYHNVEIEPSGQRDLDLWEAYCVKNILQSQRDDTPVAGLWSRAIGNVAKIAGLIAIGVNPHFPVINAEYVQFARGIIEPSLQRFTAKINGGEVEQGDARLEAEIRKLIARIEREGTGFLSSCVSYNPAIQWPNMQLSLLRWYSMKRGAFKAHKMGAGRAFDDTINAMRYAGYFDRLDVELGYNNRKTPVIRWAL